MVPTATKSNDETFAVLVGCWEWGNYRCEEVSLSTDWFVFLDLDTRCLWVEYYDTGQLDTKGSFRDGKKEGPWVSYYKDSQLWVKKTYKDGKLQKEEQ